MWACVQLPAAGGGKGPRGWPPTCLERRSWGSRNRDAWGRRRKRTLFVLCGKHALVGIQVMRLLNVVGRGRQPIREPVALIRTGPMKGVTSTSWPCCCCQTTLKTAPPSTAPKAAAQPPALDPSLSPLDPATIRQLHATIRALPAPVLEGFSKAFRKRFQVPADAPSIADRICQRRHHDWIEAFLVQHHQTYGANALQRA